MVDIIAAMLYTCMLILSLEIGSLLMLAFRSKHRYATVQPDRAASMAVDS